ncbi:MAG: hypothetical protein JWP81_1723 [Ferruginibacter sp.]|nr:hypothetical protein [Ferruginibacter sp.]
MVEQIKSPFSKFYEKMKSPDHVSAVKKNYGTGKSLWSLKGYTQLVLC